MSAEMSDQEFLSYLVAHCDTLDAGIVPAHAERLLRLAGQDDDADAWRGAPPQVIRGAHKHILDLVSKARQRAPSTAP
jgi:hypothetical protein